MIDLFGWIDARTAIDICRRIEDHDLFRVEEPVLRDDEPLGLAVVARHTRIPVAGAEGQRPLYGVRAILAAVLPHAVIIPATTSGQPPETCIRLWQDCRVERGASG